MIRATLYLPDNTPFIIQAKNTDELIHIIEQYDQRNLITMLAQAIEQLSKREAQMLALGILGELVNES